MSDSFKDTIKSHFDAVNSLLSIQDRIDAAASAMIEATRSGGTIYWMGNGGSAADAQHYAAELMVRYSIDRPPIKSLALTTDSSLLTAHSNDYEYDTVFERQVEAFATPNDVVVGISTSGNSKNVQLALQMAKKKKAIAIGLLGKDGGVIREHCDIPIVVGSNVTARIQEAHLIIGHHLCETVERAHAGLKNTT